MPSDLALTVLHIACRFSTKETDALVTGSSDSTAWVWVMATLEVAGGGKNAAWAAQQPTNALRA